MPQQPTKPKRLQTSVNEELAFRFDHLRNHKRDRSLTLSGSLDKAFADWLSKQEQAAGISPPVAVAG